jgi:hypothetical protein
VVESLPFARGQISLTIMKDELKGEGKGSDGGGLRPEIDVAPQHLEAVGKV